jgi:ribonuclease P protein component
LSETRTNSFTKSHRLAGLGTFKVILDLRVKDNRGPIVIFAKPNDLPHPRLGISIGRPVGTAVVRNRIKRLLRESFRLMQHDWPRGYDVVVIVRPHKPLMLAEYQKMLSGAMVKLHKQWTQRESAN